MSTQTPARRRARRFSDATTQSVLDVIGDQPCTLTTGTIAARVGRSAAHVRMVISHLDATGVVSIERTNPHPVTNPAGRIVTRVVA